MLFKCWAACKYPLGLCDWRSHTFTFGGGGGGGNSEIREKHPYVLGEVDGSFFCLVKHSSYHLAG